LSAFIAEKSLVNDDAETFGVELDELELEDDELVDDLFELLPHAATASAAVSARAKIVALLLSECIASSSLTCCTAGTRARRAHAFFGDY
jgi:hypothetical protein